MIDGMECEWRVYQAESSFEVSVRGGDSLGDMVEGKGGFFPIQIFNAAHPQSQISIIHHHNPTWNAMLHLHRLTFQYSSQF